MIATTLEELSDSVCAGRSGPCDLSFWGGWGGKLGGKWIKLKKMRSKRYFEEKSTGELPFPRSGQEFFSGLVDGCDPPRLFYRALRLKSLCEGNSTRDC